jgi:serine/threonine-protein kinase
MGEVYRVDDLTLGQAVALKFLPARVAADPERLARFRGEVRLARQVSHPHVCRVYDLGEADGHTFLTMEYVEGEDLATLLKKVGRLPEERGVDLARQLCQALAAAHDKGLLHRDLKPANVLIDGRGQVQLTDFGLAAAVGEVAAGDVRSGTPAYQAPEVLAGREVTVQSDLYALGLVLYELFTGKHPFPAKSRAELARLHEETSPSRPSGHVSGLDPRVEKIILRCLEKEPRDRPRSALAVAAALPGGDPLAAALAAGETPSPEVVAAAGGEGSLRPAVAISLLAVILLGTAAAAVGNDWVKVFRRAPFAHTPEHMTFLARQLLTRLGHADPPADSAWGLEEDDDYLIWLSKEEPSARRWEILATGQPAGSYFWYRQSPSWLEATDRLNDWGRVNPSHPRLTVPGMATVFLDIKGRLIELHAVPRVEPDRATPPAAPDWAPLLEAAGLDPQALKPADGPLRLAVAADRRAAWEGVFPERPEIPIRVEAASYQGNAVYFRVLSAHSDRPRIEPGGSVNSSPLSDAIELAMTVLALLGAVLLAHRNLRLGRADRRGALRLAGYVFAVYFLAWLFRAHHVTAVAVERYLLLLALGTAACWAAYLYLAYLAIEPSFRRRWPWRVVGWGRVLAGRLRDPLVGREILVGGVGAVAVTLLDRCHSVLADWLGLPCFPYITLIRANVSASQIPGAIFFELTKVTYVLMMYTFCFLVILLCRKEWLGVGVAFTLTTLQYFSNPGGTNWLGVVCVTIRIGIFVFVSLRFGLLAGNVLFFCWLVLSWLPLTYDVTAWYATSSAAYALVVVALALYGFVISLGGRPLFGKGLFAEE